MSHVIKHHSEIGTPKHRAENLGVEPPVVRTANGYLSNAKRGHVGVALYGFPADSQYACEQFTTYLTINAAQQLGTDLLKAVAEHRRATEQRDAA